MKVWGQSSPGREAGPPTGSCKGRAGRTKERGRCFRLEDLALINKELDLGDVMRSLEGSGSPPCPAEPSRFIQKPSWVQSHAPSRSPQSRFTSVKAVSLKGFWAGSVSGRYSPRIGRGEGAANHSGPAGGSTVIMSS